MVASRAPSGGQALERRATFFRLQSLDCIRNNCDFAAALEESFGCKLHAVFRNDPEHEILRIQSEALDKFRRMGIAEDVEHLFFNDHLPRVRQIAG